MAAGCSPRAPLAMPQSAADHRTPFRSLVR
jgi:hypothetical protein